MQIDSLIQQNPKMKKCPCGAFMEVQEGKVDYNQKDDAGKVLSREAAQHMAKHRARCVACKENFCSGCNTKPYHIGISCEKLVKLKNARKCRFCKSELKGKLGIGINAEVCQKKECIKLKGLSCTKRLQCGHACKGFKDEPYCLPCLAPECNQIEGINDDTFCSICWTDGLGSEPCVQLHCKHVFHLNCMMKLIEKKWSTPRVVFNFLNCPSCKQRIVADHCP